MNEPSVMSEMASEMVSVLAQYLPLEMAVEVSAQICERMGRGYHYVPSPQSLRRLARDAAIYRRYDGPGSLPQLADEFGLSTRGVYRAITRARRLRGAMRSR